MAPMVMVPDLEVRGRISSSKQEPALSLILCLCLFSVHHSVAVSSKTEALTLMVAAYSLFSLGLSLSSTLLGVQAPVSSQGHSDENQLQAEPSVYSVIHSTYLQE